MIFRSRHSSRQIKRRMSIQNLGRIRPPSRLHPRNRRHWHSPRVNRYRLWVTRRCSRLLCRLCSRQGGRPRKSRSNWPRHSNRQWWRSNRSKVELPSNLLRVNKARRKLRLKPRHRHRLSRWLLKRWHLNRINPRRVTLNQLSLRPKRILSSRSLGLRLRAKVSLLTRFKQLLLRPRHKPKRFRINLLSLKQLSNLNKKHSLSKRPKSRHLLQKRKKSRKHNQKLRLPKSRKLWLPLWPKRSPSKKIKQNLNWLNKLREEKLWKRNWPKKFKRTRQARKRKRPKSKNNHPKLQRLWRKSRWKNSTRQRLPSLTSRSRNRLLKMWLPQKSKFQIHNRTNLSFLSLWTNPN